MCQCSPSSFRVCSRSVLTRQGADLDGEIVVAPFRWQILNVDVAARLTARGTLVVIILVDGENFQDFLLDGTKKISVGFSGADQLPPGEYTITIKLADESSGTWDGDEYYLLSDPVLLGIESPPRKLVVESDKGSFFEHAPFVRIGSGCQTPGLAVLTALDTSQLAYLADLAARWNGHVSAAIFVSAAEQEESARAGRDKHDVAAVSDLRSNLVGSGEVW